LFKISIFKDENYELPGLATFMAGVIPPISQLAVSPILSADEPKMAVFF